MVAEGMVVVNLVVQVDTAAAALAVVVKALEVVAYNRAGSLSTHGNCRLFRTLLPMVQGGYSTSHHRGVPKPPGRLRVAPAAMGGVEKVMGMAAVVEETTAVVMAVAVVMVDLMVGFQVVEEVVMEEETAVEMVEEAEVVERAVGDLVEVMAAGGTEVVREAMEAERAVVKAVAKEEVKAAAKGVGRA